MLQNPLIHVTKAFLFPRSTLLLKVYSDLTIAELKPFYVIFAVKIVNDGANNRLITLGPAYNKLGYNEHILITNSFFCIILLVVSGTQCTYLRLRHVAFAII